MSKDIEIIQGDWDTPEAVVVDGFVFLSGSTTKQLDGTYVGHGDMVEQSSILIDKVGERLVAAGTDWDHVVKITVFVADIADLGIFNAEYVRRFPTRRPARTTIQAGGFEPGARLELDVIAVRP